MKRQQAPAYPELAMRWLPSGVSGQRVLVAPAAILSGHTPLRPLGLCCDETQSSFFCAEPKLTPETQPIGRSKSRRCRAFARVLTAWAHPTRQRWRSRRACSRVSGVPRTLVASMQRDNDPNMRVPNTKRARQCQHAVVRLYARTYRLRVLSGPRARTGTRILALGRRVNWAKLRVC